MRRACTRPQQWNGKGGCGSQRRLTEWRAVEEQLEVVSEREVSGVTVGCREKASQRQKQYLALDRWVYGAVGGHPRGEEQKTAECLVRSSAERSVLRGAWCFYAKGRGY